MSRHKKGLKTHSWVCVNFCQFLVLFVFKCWNFFPDFVGDVEKRIDRMARVSFKICEPCIGKLIIIIPILTNISRSKDNQTMKFGQLVEYNMGNIFLRKSYWKWGRKVSFRLLFVLWNSINEVKASG